MPGHDIIVVGASAGGVEALMKLVAGLPVDLRAAVLVVLHIPSEATSLLPQILARSGNLPAVHALDGMRLEPGHIYVAPPDHHLLVERGFVRVVRGPRENRHRPAVDPLFRSAAIAYGPRVVGVVLSGTLDDGTAGLHAIKLRGGVAVVQDPDDALFGDMPRNALEYVNVDFCLPVQAIPTVLTQLAEAVVDEKGDAVAEATQPDMQYEADIAGLDREALTDEDKPGTPSVYACPECHGTLWEIHEGNVLRFRCRVGHAFTAQSLLAEHNDSLERALWAALRALEENAALTRRLAGRAVERGLDAARSRFEQRAEEAETHAEAIRSAILALRPPETAVEMDEAASA